MARWIGIFLSYCVVGSTRVDDNGVAMMKSMNLPQTTVGDEDCETGVVGARYIRIQSISGKKLAQGSDPDPDFPPKIDSIAPPKGTDCGKSAEEVQTKCGEFDTWGDVKEMSTDFKVIGPSGIDFNDIAQGRLGTCYLLATLAAIAFKNPKVIEGMFLEKEKWSDGIYTTRWFINGKESIIQVDGMIPMDKEAKKPFFVQPSPTGEVWPIILSKSWAKIFGAYKNAEGGVPTEVFTAITGAPVAELGVDDPDALWAALSTAFENNFAVTAGSSKNDIGLVPGHAYVVLGVSMKKSDGGKVKAVKMYNPWHRDQYKGVFSKDGDDKTDGTFTMAFDEYVKVFEQTQIAQIRPGYSPKVITIPVGYDYSALTFTASSDAPFVASINWPGMRVLQPCFRINTPDFIVAIKKAGAANEETTIVERETYPEMSYGYTAHSKDLVGKGKYIMVARTILGERGNFWPKTKFVTEVSVSVYADAGSSLIVATGSDFEEAATMLGGGYPAGDKLCLDSQIFWEAKCYDLWEQNQCKMLQVPFACPVSCGLCGPKTTTTTVTMGDIVPGSKEDLATRMKCNPKFEECEMEIKGKKMLCKNNYNYQEQKYEGLQCKPKAVEMQIGGEKMLCQDEGTKCRCPCCDGYTGDKVSVDNQFTWDEKTSSSKTIQIKRCGCCMKD